MATIEQLKKSLFDKGSQIGNIRREMQVIRDQLRALAEFKPGDKVLVTLKYWDTTQPIKPKIAFIRDVIINYNNNITYTFNKVKKDGTQSQRSAGIYSFTKIEHYHE